MAYSGLVGEIVTGTRGGQSLSGSGTWDALVPFEDVEANGARSRVSFLWERKFLAKDEIVYFDLINFISLCLRRF